jgi:hypothetical protein
VAEAAIDLVIGHVDFVAVSYRLGILRARGCGEQKEGKKRNGDGGLPSRSGHRSSFVSRYYCDS